MAGRLPIRSHEAGGGRPALRGHSYPGVAERVEITKARISVKRLLPAAWAAGYAGSAGIGSGIRPGDTEHDHPDDR